MKHTHKFRTLREGKSVIGVYVNTIVQCDKCGKLFSIDDDDKIEEVKLKSKEIKL